MIRAAIGATFLAGSVLAQCEGWMPIPGDGSPYASGEVLAAAVFDADGPGPLPEQLLVGGSSLSFPGVRGASVYRWDGVRWLAFGGPFDASVMALQVWNGGLYGAGDFTVVGGRSARGIVRWSGTEWDPLPGEPLTRASGPATVRAMTEFDGHLVLAGAFDGAGGAAASNVAVWDGSAFHALGAGVNGYARAAVEHGGRLIVGGDFTLAGGRRASHLASWDGSSWREVGPSPAREGVDGGVRALASDGGALYVGGFFSSAGGLITASNIARWDGSAWSAMGGGASGIVRGLLAVPEGVVALGLFRFMSGVESPGMALWTGGRWSTALGPLALDVGAGGASLSGITALRWGEGLVVGGFFDRVGGVSAPGIAVHGEQGWVPLGARGLAGGSIAATAVYRGTVYAGGSFREYAGRALGGLARWDGRGWEPVQGWLGGSVVDSLVVGDDRLWISGSLAPSGDPAGGTTAAAYFDGAGVVYAQGGRAVSAGRAAFWRGRLVLPARQVDPSVACWDGEAWSELSSGTPPAPLKLRHVAVYGGELYGDVDGQTPAQVVGSEGEGWVVLPTAGVQGIADLCVAEERLCAGGGIWNPSFGAWDGRAWAANGEQYVIPRLAPTAGGLFAFAYGYYGDERLLRVEAATGHGMPVPWPTDMSVLGAPRAVVGDFFGGLLASGQPRRGYASAGAHAVRVSGPPVVIGEPRPPGDASDPRVDVVVIGVGLSYQWRRDGVDVPGADGAELAVSRRWIAGWYDCVVSNGCGAVVSAAVRVDTCAADHDGDGFIDFFDHLAFVADFEAGEASADVNADGFVDVFDFADFVAVFEAGC